MSIVGEPWDSKVEPSPPSGAAASPATWLPWLFFLPDRFFRAFTHSTPTLVVALCVWLYGMSGVIDRIETDSLRPSPRYDLIRETWSNYLLAVVLGGILAGIMYYAVGGWWYRARLGFCGADRADPFVVRRVYVFSAVVIALLPVLYTFMEPLWYATPGDSANGGELWPLLLLVFPFWSVFVSYRGVRTVFPESKVWATRVWFGVLPTILYAVVIGGVFVWAVVAGLGAAADVKNPRAFSSATMRFDYPGNWDIPGGEDFDPEASVTVEPVQDAAIMFTIYPSDRPHRDEVADTLAAFGETFGQIDEVGEFTQWGGLEGYGKETRAHLKSHVYRTRVFVHSIGEYQRLEVREIVLVDDEEKLRPGFDLIESSFQLQGVAADGGEVDVEMEPPLPTGAPKAPIAP